MKSIIHLSTNSLNGGAGIAATRVHEAISTLENVKSLFYSEYIKKFEATSFIYENKYRTFYRKCLSKSYRLFLSKLPFLDHHFQSFSFLPVVPYNNLDKKFKPDIYNLHWVQHEFLSLGEIKNLPKNRIVWTLHDCWPILGSDHYPGTTKKTGINYKFDNYLKTYKKKLIKSKNIQFVAPSNWMKNLTEKYFEEFKPNVKVIPYPIPDIFFNSISQEIARERLNLPKDKTLILFSSFSGEDKRKGLDKVYQLLKNKEINKLNIQFITIGKINNFKNLQNLKNLGMIKNYKKLVEIYNAIDIVLVPSLIDNLPQVALEAQACGKPVIGSKSGGISDIVLEGETGFLSDTNDVNQIIKSIKMVLNNSLHKKKNSIFIRKRAKSLWHGDVISNSYDNLYNEMLSK